jgi:hypothetical protein
MEDKKEPVGNCFEAVDKYDYEDFDTLFEYLHESSSAPVDDDAPPEEGIGNWMSVKNFDCNIDVNTIDALLLNQARKEIPMVLKRILRQHNPDVTGGDWIKSIHLLEPIDLFDVWIGRSKGYDSQSRPLLLTMQKWVQSYINQLKDYQGIQQISVEELILFIKAELLMSFYKCSPKQYYSKALRKRYPEAEFGISKSRYKLVLRALSKSDHMNDDYDDDLEWSAPNESDSVMAKVVKGFRNFCSSLAFIKNLSWVCFDDDLMRHRSRSIPNFGYAQINNPAKGMGVIHHAAVGVLTCLYLGGHIPNFGETTYECVKLIQMALVGIVTIGNLILKGILFFWDRGYGGTKGKVNTSTIQAGANIVTTCQRQQSFPFTYGQNAGPSRQLIQESGAPSCYWASKNLQTKEGKTTQQYALAYRNGLSRVVLMSTTMPQCGPGQFTFITKSHSFAAMRGEWVRDDFDSDNEKDDCEIGLDHNENELEDNENEVDDDDIESDDDDSESESDDDIESDDEDDQAKENRRNTKQIWELFESMIVRQLTVAQRCPEWFLLRQFRITGTSAYSIWKFSNVVLEPEYKPVLIAIGLIAQETTSVDYTSDASDEVTASKKKPEKKVAAKSDRPPEYQLSVRELKARLPAMGRPIRDLSNKEDLVKALIRAIEEEENEDSDFETDDCSEEDEEDDGEYDSDNIEDLLKNESELVRNNITRDLLKGWFMAPLNGMTATKIGNANEKNVVKHLPSFLLKYSQLEILEIKEYGLLAKRGNSQQVFSPDGIIGFLKRSTTTNKYFFELGLLEIKTHVSAIELGKEFDLLARYGPYVRVNVIDPMFGKLIRFKKYRAQVIHGMASGELRDGFYVVASSTRIIRIVHVTMSETFSDLYNDGLENLCKFAKLEWAETGVGIPTFTEEEFQGPKLKYAVDNETIRKTWKLWKALDDLVQVRSKPLPRGKYIVPTAIALWNRCKGPIDVYSRYLRNAKQKHGTLRITGSIWIRLIMTVVYNAFMSYCMCKTVAFLLSDECISYRQYQNYKKRKGGSFAEFISNLCKQLRAQAFDESDPLSVDEIATSNTLDISTITEDYPERRVRNRGKCYNKREYFFSDHELICLRRRNRPEHKSDQGGRQLRCVWCCENHSLSKVADGFICNSRSGYKTKYSCRLCKVPLCNVIRYRNKTCHDQWHNAKKNDPCQSMIRTGLVDPKI